MPRILGPIVRLQVQRSPLKIGEKPNRRYDPGPIVPVDRMRLTPDGAYGLANGHEILDVHNRLHPQTRAERPENALSIGFTGHYAEMRRRFGEHMVVGCAGESVIVEANRRVRLEELLGGLVILAPDGRERLRLTGIRVAAPCKPFSGFAHRHQVVEPEVLKATLQFLDEGTRGFYCVPQAQQAVDIQVGDALAVL
jgi:hypothetical protein